MRVRLIAAILAAILMTACTENDAEKAAPAPAPNEITREAIGYYCNMIVADHRGPKGQVHIQGRDAPIWFSSVRDAIVFTLLPEEPKNIAAIYVNDMGRASWDHPEPGTWIDARRAWYVVGSDKVGGMGAPEAVPFADKGNAESFAGRHGGQVVAFAEVPEDYVLSDASTSQHAAKHQGMGRMHHAMPESQGMPGASGDDTSMQHAHGHSSTEGVK